ncbi:alpha-L-glutamate ligase [Rhizobium leguminosarum]|uniref:MvdC/MvdD family ATP grasp protein n=1 Tax=Rhizobium TaxID=379 RepID=UPI00102F75CE|nr:alpha-L-glutamate ligase [Rhizobium leguminosarum]TBF87898.1 alpha-L-glutamate ligase [Rhizobium leguminosarum]TBG07121.1 alpha-L-glutamate ligase [Rhizobium leguminosarum]TBG07685.1 alpha-L-glutamate ligase [Rhizobium leguminosarum]TBG30805.1 alpha-L-glutamate ligase [Rhizobium leguminosarum]TBG50051.1 alpha-L-glutamate ligase [Rhizobium leguminosarum]
MILVISYPQEEHTDAVVSHLNAAGRDVARIDMAEFPYHSSLEMHWKNGDSPRYSLHRADGTSLAMAAIRVAWWRRVRPYTIDPAIRDVEMRAFAESETAQAIGGMFDGLKCRWVNPRAADDAAHRKPYQWTVAQKIGLSLPRTLVTSNPGAAREFIRAMAPNRVVFKPFLATLQSWRETRIIETTDVERLDLVRLAPVIFQEYIAGADLRVTLIGDRIFAAEIDARTTSYPFDMRMVIEEAILRPIDLPDRLAEALLKLQRTLNLDYGAVDLRRTDDGEYFFLEVNPAGQWLFVEERTGLPIAQAMANYLAEVEDANLG